MAKFSKFITTALQDLVKKYDGMVFKQQPPSALSKQKTRQQQAEFGRSQTPECNESDEDEEEIQRRRNNAKYKLGKWKYSLLNAANVKLKEASFYNERNLESAYEHSSPVKQ